MISCRPARLNVPDVLAPSRYRYLPRLPLQRALQRSQQFQIRAQTCSIDRGSCVRRPQNLLVQRRQRAVATCLQLAEQSESGSLSLFPSSKSHIFLSSRVLRRFPDGTNWYPRAFLDAYRPLDPLPHVTRGMLDPVSERLATSSCRHISTVMRT